MTPSDLPSASTHSWRFWAVFPGLCFSILLAGLDTSIVATALPTITADLNSGALYVWIINGYFLSTAAVQPLFGQASDIFGRRIPMLLSIALFTIGSGLCGGAKDTPMLIAARLVQGIGGGGLFVMVDIIVADLVALRDRQKYMSVIMATFALGTFIGPIIGGVIVTDISWRWVFYINLPIGGTAFVLVFLFLRVHNKREGNLLSRLRRVDLLGNALLMSAVVSVLIALTWGGTLYAWDSYHILVPLLIGVAGLGFFYIHQKYWALEATMPIRVYSNSVSLLAFILTFLHGIEMSWLSFFLPVYFQVLLEASPLKSGVNLLAIVIPLMPAGIAGGLMIAKTGRYKPTMVAGYALLSIGVGCLTLLDTHSSTAKWIIIQIIAGLGGGLALTATLPAVQAPLSESDVAVATASWAFVRSFGSIWGVAIPSAVFNSRVDNLLNTISDPATRKIMKRGGAYQHATASFMASFNDTPSLKQELVEIYTASIKESWQVLIAFAVAAVPIVCFIREVPLRKELVTEFGLDETDNNKASTNNETELVARSSGRE
jgi:EmrB/QacA subfamily drug resistance transporter